MEYRVEKKYLVTEADLAAIAGRLKQVMLQDIHQHGSFYNIRSIYFDDLQNHCAFETRLVWINGKSTEFASMTALLL